MDNSKVVYSLKLIEKALKESNNPVISFSGGKDSTVLLHLIIKVAGNSVPILHINTGVEFPEALEFRDKQIEKHNLTLYEQPAFPETYWTVVEKYGFPVGQRGFKGGEATTKCCYYLKKKPLHRAIKRFNIDLNFTGIRANESHNRAIIRKTHGDYYYNKRHKIKVCHPIMHWTNTEIDTYINNEGIELSPIYNKKLPEKPNYRIRTGCWACPQGWNAGKSVWLKTYYPEFYTTLMKKGFAKYIMERKTGESVTTNHALNILKVRPCFFESL